MTDRHVVVLSWEEVFRGAFLGLQRNLYAAIDGREPRFGLHSDCWGPHIQGALAELAFAKWMNCYWEGHACTYTSKPDVAGCEVRWSARDVLKRKENDKSNQKIVLVTGQITDTTPVRDKQLPYMTIRGWLWPHEFESFGKLEDPGGHGRPAWFVHADFLRPMSELQ